MSVCHTCSTQVNRPVFIRKAVVRRGKKQFEDKPFAEFRCSCGNSVYSGDLPLALQDRKNPIFVDHITD